jgi:hypothetical protein
MDGDFGFNASGSSGMCGEGDPECQQPGGVPHADGGADALPGAAAESAGAVAYSRARARAATAGASDALPGFPTTFTFPIMGAASGAGAVPLYEVPLAGECAAAAAAASGGLPPAGARRSPPSFGRRLLEVDSEDDDEVEVEGEDADGDVLMAGIPSPQAPAAGDAAAAADVAARLAAPGMRAGLTAEIAGMLRTARLHHLLPAAQVAAFVLALAASGYAMLTPCRNGAATAASARPLGSAPAAAAPTSDLRAFCAAVAASASAPVSSPRSAGGAHGRHVARAAVPSAGRGMTHGLAGVL